MSNGSGDRSAVDAGREVEEGADGKQQQRQQQQRHHRQQQHQGAASTGTDWHRLAPTGPNSSPLSLLAPPPPPRLPRLLRPLHNSSNKEQQHQDQHQQQQQQQRGDRPWPISNQGRGSTIRCDATHAAGKGLPSESMEPVVRNHILD